jgi:hypothetical protein
VVAELSARLARQLSMADTTRRDAQPEITIRAGSSASAATTAANQPARPTWFVRIVGRTGNALRVPPRPFVDAQNPSQHRWPSLRRHPPAHRLGAGSVGQPDSAGAPNSTERHDAGGPRAAGPTTRRSVVVMTYARAIESQDLLYRIGNRICRLTSSAVETASAPSRRRKSMWPFSQSNSEDRTHRSA